MTQLQYLPDLLLTVLFGVNASLTHPGILSPEKERLGDSELKAIVKRTQSSEEAREILAFNPRVWAALCETLKAGNTQLIGSWSKEKGPAADNKVEHVGCRCHEGGDGSEHKQVTSGRKDKSYLLPKVWEVVILGRNLLATKERGQDLAAESKFEEEVRKLCEICVRHTDKDSYHKVLITCLQFLNNLISGNEKRKMSLWMQLFVPGSTRLLEAAKRKAMKQYQSKITKDAKATEPKEAAKKTVEAKPSTPEKLDSDLDTAGTSSPGDTKMSFIALLPTVLNAKEMLPLLLIIHGSITELDGADPARQLMRCKMMLAAEAGIGLMAGLLMFVDAWHEIEDHIYFELILEIMETILHHGLITYLFETLKEYVDIQYFHPEPQGKHAITPPQAVVLRLLHTIFAPATLPAFPDPAFMQQYERRMTEKIPDTKGGDVFGLTEKYTKELNSMIVRGGGLSAPSKSGSQSSDPDGEDGDDDTIDPGPDIINFLAVKVLKNQLGPAVREMIAGLGQQKRDSEIFHEAVKRLEKGGLSKDQEAATRAEFSTHNRLKYVNRMGGVAEANNNIPGCSIYDVELHYEGLVQLLELLVLFAESSSGRSYLRSTGCGEELVKLLTDLDEYIPRTTIKNAKMVADLSESNDPSEFRWPLIKRTLVQLLSLMVYGCKEMQDEVRKYGGVERILNQCNIDDENPFIREHAVLCIRNLLEGNQENQAIVKELEAQKPVQTAQLEAAGMETFIDKEGKVKVGVKKKNKKKK